jgi:hypothetical protein
MHQLELLKLKDQLQAEIDRTKNLQGISAKLAESTEDSRQNKALTAERLREFEACVEASNIEMWTITEQRNKLEGKLADMTREFKG